MLLSAVVAALLAAAVGSGAHAVAVAGPGSGDFAVQPFSVAFLREYWLHFELTSVLLLAAVVAAITVIKGGRRHDG